MGCFEQSRRTESPAAIRIGACAAACAWILGSSAPAANLNETIVAAQGAVGYLEAALIDPPESGGDRWGVFEGFEIGGDGFVGGWELPGSYAAAGRALLQAYVLAGDPDLFDEAEAVAAYLLDNQNRAVTYLTDWGFAPGGVLVVEGGNPTFYTAHQARVALFLVEMYGATLDPTYLDAASDIAAFASAEMLSDEIGTPNEGGYVYTQDISRLVWPWMFVVGYSEAEMALALSRLEPHGLRAEDWAELLTVADHLDSVQQDADGGIYWTNRDLDRNPLGSDARAGIAAAPLREAGLRGAAGEVDAWLEAQQALDGGFYSPQPLIDSSDLTRENAYAVRALLDAGYDPDGGVLDLATDWLVAAQLPDGSFPILGGDFAGDDDASSAAALAIMAALGGGCAVTPLVEEGYEVAQGGTVEFTATLWNHGPFQASTQAWYEVVLPNDSAVTIGPAPVLIGARSSVVAPVAVPIPLGAPLGDYFLRLHCGSLAPLAVDDRDVFRFQVISP